MCSSSSKQLIISDKKNYSDNYSDIEKYEKFWLSMFPEINDLETLENLLKDISNKDLIEFYKDHKQNALDQNEYVKNILSVELDAELEQNLDSMLYFFETDNRWAYFFKPILKKYFKQIHDVVFRSNIILDKQKFLQKIIMDILQKLTNKSFRVLVLETNIASSENLLKGETKYERSNYFYQVLLKDNNYIDDIFSIYPELVRILDTYTKNVIMYISEIIRNTENEYPIIRNKFTNDGELGRIVKFELGMGDTHNKNKSVAIIKFDSNVSVVYKPRKLDIEMNFNNFIKWINNEIEEFKTLKGCKCHTIESGGWMEFIENSDCTSSKQVEDFYKRMGQLLCILYTLNSIDCHFENIIANGEFPILIDLETLLHLDNLSTENDFYDIDMYVAKNIKNSVLNIGLLPSLLMNYKTEKVMEVGGLGSTKKKIAPFKSQVLKNTDSDDIYVDNVYKEITEQLNMPKLGDSIIEPSKYIGEIKTGFVNTYKWVLINKDKYINKVKDEFYNLESRIVHKNTNLYTQLIETSYHPDLLHNKVDREIYFHRIGMAVDQSRKSDEYKLCRFEIDEMLCADVPIYKVLNSESILRDNNNNRYENFYKTNVFNAIKNKIEKLSQIDLKRQISIINQSFFGCKIEIDLETKTKTKFNNIPEMLNEDMLGKVSLELGNLIIERSISAVINNQTYCSWIGLKGFGDDFYNISPVGRELYSGNGGIALFISRLAEKTGSTEHRNFAKTALNSVIKSLEDLTKSKYEEHGIGVFSGITSYYYSIYKAIKQEVFTKEESIKLIVLLESKLDLLHESILIENNLDLTNGISGTLGALISIYDIVGETSRDKIIRICNDILSKLKQELIYLDDGSITWYVNDIGYAHGNAGIITQIMRLYNITKDESIINLVDKILQYEKSKFDKSQSKWTFRGNAHYFSWCNGIGGLLLSKIYLHTLKYRDENLLDDILILTNQLKEYGFGMNHSICHGDIGSLSLLYYAAEVLDDNKLKQECNRTLNQFCSEFVLNKWDIFEMTEDWGLMTGASGVGLGLTSLGRESIITDILLLK